MDNHIDTSEFLNLFSLDTGLKYLTHDIKASGLDLVDYTYNCQMLTLDWAGRVPEELFNLVRGFIFGPCWTDFKGDRHTSFCSSDEWVNCYLETGEHPMKSGQFSEEVEAFRHSIRFRTGQLEKFLTEIKDMFPALNIEISRSVKGADFYTSTRHLMSAIEEILSSMNELSAEHPYIRIGFEDIDGEDLSEELRDFSKAVITIEQPGSFPKHSFARDKEKFSNGGGTLANIMKALKGYADWAVISSWNDGTEPVRWMPMTGEFIRPGHQPEGFRHEISILYKA